MHVAQFFKGSILPIYPKLRDLRVSTLSRSIQFSDLAVVWAKQRSIWIVARSYWHNSLRNQRTSKTTEHHKFISKNSIHLSKTGLKRFVSNTIETSAASIRDKADNLTSIEQKGASSGKTSQWIQEANHASAEQPQIKPAPYSGAGLSGHFEFLSRVF